MGIVGRLRRNWDHVSLLGPGVLLRHLRSRRAVTEHRMRGVGPVHLRLADSDLETFKQVFVAREYDMRFIGVARERVDARYRQILADGKAPVIIDAGANVGAASLWFSRLFPDAAIVAIEPDAGNAGLLRMNTADLPQVTVVEAAIAGAAGQVTLDTGSQGWAVQASRAETGDVAAITMADAIARVPKGAPFIAKVDIEGFEADLFSENLDWIDDTVMVIVEPHDWLFPGRGTSHSFQAAMGARRFELFIAGENLIYVAS